MVVQDHHHDQRHHPRPVPLRQRPARRPLLRLEPGALPPPEATRHLVPLVERAIQAHRTGRHRDRRAPVPRRAGTGARPARRADRPVPNPQGTGQACCAAEALIRRIVALDPNNFGATNELALMLLGKGDLAEGRNPRPQRRPHRAGEPAGAQPDGHDPDRGATRPQVGEYHYRRVLELTGARDPILLANLAWNLKNQGRMEEARALYQESVAAAPEDPPDPARLGAAGGGRPQFRRRRRRCSTALDALCPERSRRLLSRAVLLGRMRRLRRGAGDPGRHRPMTATAELGANELLEKGRLLDQMGRYDDAFAAFAEGKRLARELSGHDYLDDSAQQLIEPAARLLHRRPPAHSCRAPASADRRAAADLHPRLSALRHHAGRADPVGASAHRRRRRAAADQRHHRHHAAHARTARSATPRRWPNSGWATSAKASTICATTTCRRCGRWASCATAPHWFTDKMPLNETHLGLIALLFPAGAADPCASAIRWTSWSRRSPTSSPTASSAPMRLETAARHYVRVMDLVQHYRARDGAALSAGPLRGHRRRPGGERPQHAGFHRRAVSTHAACSFHENRRYARTASYAQVTEQLV